VIVKFLGTHNAESKNTRLVSFLIDDVLAVDAGSLVSELTFPEQRRIKAILLSHGHYDHIKASLLLPLTIPTVLQRFLPLRRPLKFSRLT
jgi:L-ascorbate metabolism protein UlaG (beta-lactamase superfamily)